MFMFANEEDELEKPYVDFFSYINKVNVDKQNFSISVQPDVDLCNEEIKEEQLLSTNKKSDESSTVYD